MSTELPDVVSIPEGEDMPAFGIHIDYDIIELFSDHLYEKPSKAIEELVINGFDAFAKEVRVFLPLEYCPKSIIVWDDGQAMDTEGMKALWQIARSPKKKLSGNRLINRDSGRRYVIGKFGIGKLASYTLGNIVTHCCKKNNSYYFIRVDYKDLINRESEVRQREVELKVKTLTEEEARKFLQNHFENIPESFDGFFAKESWTFAVVSDLKEVNTKNLANAGQLRWILGNSMPMRPDFSIYVEEKPVVPSLEKKDNLHSWDFSDEEIQKSIKSRWMDLKEKEDIAYVEPKFGKEKGLDPNDPNKEIPYVEFANLGKVWGRIALYDQSLKEGDTRAGEYGRSYGYFVYVRGRLVNEGNHLLYLHDPSYGTYYRSQYLLNIDKLDEELSADREGFKQSDKITELKYLQKAIYSVTNKQREIEEQNEQESAKKDLDFNARLPVYSRQYFIEPVSTLFSKKGNHSESSINFDYDNPNIITEPNATSERLSYMDTDREVFVINTEHPLYKVFKDNAGGGKVSYRVMREFENLLAMEPVFEGYLYEIGIEDEKVDSIVKWRNSMYKLVAQGNKSSLSNLKSEIVSASYIGGKHFEIAIKKGLERMGFTAAVDGNSGKKDILANAFCGIDEGYTITFEAKGKKSGSLANDDAEISGAAAHREEVDADHAVVIAREFSGFTRGDEPAVLKECQSVGKVSIMEVAAFNKLLDVMERYRFPIDSIKEVFTTIESPSDKLKRIEALEQEIEDFNYRSILDYIYEKQVEREGAPILYENVFYEMGLNKGLKKEALNSALDRFKRAIEALSILAFPYVNIEPQAGKITLRQKPDIIVEAIKEKLDKLGQKSE